MLIKRSAYKTAHAHLHDVQRTVVYKYIHIYIENSA